MLSARFPEPTRRTSLSCSARISIPGTREQAQPTTPTDHLSFDAVGLPGFQFIQDPVEYNSRTHHSNMDVYERIQAPDMMKNAVIVASFVYLAANRDEKLPRKPLPSPAR